MCRSCCLRDLNGLWYVEVGNVQRKKTMLFKELMPEVRNVKFLFYGIEKSLRSGWLPTVAVAMPNYFEGAKNSGQAILDNIWWHSD